MKTRVYKLWKTQILWTPWSFANLTFIHTCAWLVIIQHQVNPSDEFFLFEASLRCTSPIEDTFDIASLTLVLPILLPLLFACQGQRTPLHSAAKYGHDAVCARLISLGAAVDAKDAASRHYARHRELTVKFSRETCHSGLMRRDSMLMRLAAYTARIY